MAIAFHIWKAVVSNLLQVAEHFTKLKVNRYVFGSSPYVPSLQSNSCNIVLFYRSLKVMKSWQWSKCSVFSVFSDFIFKTKYSSPALLAHLTVGLTLWKYGQSVRQQLPCLWLQQCYCQGQNAQRKWVKWFHNSTCLWMTCMMLVIWLYLYPIACNFRTSRTHLSGV